MRTISTIIIKPTKGCNADCTYCCAPPDGAAKWSIEDFKRVFDALEHRLHPQATFIWHGGEPMLLGPKFYSDAFAYAQIKLPQVQFSMQSNILSYNERWNKVFRDVFKGSVSTSWDPDESSRTINGRSDIYSQVYNNKIGKILNDGWRPKIISTFTDETIDMAHKVYDRALESDRKGQTYDFRINYRYPAGRASADAPALDPTTYGRVLLELYDRWIVDTPGFLVTPLDEMFKKVTGKEIARCPWAKGCTGRIIGMEPNFDVYNCGEFADLADPEYCFGNLLTDGIDACLSSEAARKLAMRRVKQPKSCQKCIHFAECEGGCMRDSVLFNRGLYGKFFYCESWQEVFSRIKESILNGEADRAVAKFGHDPEMMRQAVLSRVSMGLDAGATNMRRPVLSLGHMPTFGDLNDPVDLN